MSVHVHFTSLALIQGTDKIVICRILLLNAFILKSF